MADRIRHTPDVLIFVLDDDEHVLSAVSRMLETRPGTEVRAYSSLDEMMTDPELFRADLFVLDVILPGGISGFNVPSKLPPRCRLAAFLFVSGFSFDADQYKQASGLPLFDFLAKPFSLVQLIHRVNLLLSARIRIPIGVDDRLLSQWVRESFLSIVLDTTGRIRLCNRFGAEALGFEKPAAVVGRDWAEFDPDGVKFPADAATNEADGMIRAADGTLSRIKWIRTEFDDPDGGTMLLLIGVYAGARNRRTDRLRRLYREILKNDREAIRAIKPLTAPDPAACLL